MYTHASRVLMRHTCIKTTKLEQSSPPSASGTGWTGRVEQGVVPSQQRPGQRHSRDDLAHAPGLSAVGEADGEGQRHVGRATATAASSSTPRETADSAHTWLTWLAARQGGAGQSSQARNRHHGTDRRGSGCGHSANQGKCARAVTTPRARAARNGATHAF